MNKLNEPHTGGMSSFLLFHLVYFFFIQYKNTDNGEIEEEEQFIKV